MQVMYSSLKTTHSTPARDRDHWSPQWWVAAPGPRVAAGRHSICQGSLHIPVSLPPHEPNEPSSSQRICNAACLQCWTPTALFKHAALVMSRLPAVPHLPPKDCRPSSCPSCSHSVGSSCCGCGISPQFLHLVPLVTPWSLFAAPGTVGQDGNLALLAHFACLMRKSGGFQNLYLMPLSWLN